MTTTITIPTLHTTRLVLRAPRMSDFEAYAAFRGSPRAVFLGGPYDRATAFEQLSSIIGGWHLRGYGRWMVADADTDAPLGIVGLFFPEDWPEPESRGRCSRGQRVAVSHTRRHSPPATMPMARWAGQPRSA